MKTPGKLNKRQEQRRDDLLKAARKVFATHGFHGAAVSDIVKEAGVAQGTFYLYFSDKKGAFYEILDSFLGELKSILLAQPDAVHYRDMALALTQHFVKNGDLARIFFREASGLDEESERRLREFYSFVYAKVEADIRRGIATGNKRNVNPTIGAYALVGMIEKVIYECAVNGLPLPPEQIAEEVRRLQMFGLVETPMPQPAASSPQE